MGKITLVTGSFKSGRSRWAVSQFECCNNIQYLCTAEKIGKKVMDRIVYTESSHNICWDLRCNFSFEAPPDDLFEYDSFIIDSVGKYVAAFDFDDLDSDDPSSETEFEKRVNWLVLQITDFVRKLKASGKNAVIITEETGFVMWGDDETSYIVSALCEVNQRLAAIADEVYLSVSGVQFKIK